MVCCDLVVLQFSALGEEFDWEVKYDSIDCTDSKAFDRIHEFLVYLN